ncbi:hypothetical protein STENM327S_01054 [Streptomyces tendae]
MGSFGQAAGVLPIRPSASATRSWSAFAGRAGWPPVTRSVRPGRTGRAPSARPEAELRDRSALSSVERSARPSAPCARAAAGSPGVAASTVSRQSSKPSRVAVPSRVRVIPGHPVLGSGVVGLSQAASSAAVPAPVRAFGHAGPRCGRRRGCARVEHGCARLGGELTGGVLDLGYRCRRDGHGSGRYCAFAPRASRPGLPRCPRRRASILAPSSHLAGKASTIAGAAVLSARAGHDAGLVVGVSRRPAGHDGALDHGRTVGEMWPPRTAVQCPRRAG